MGTLWRAGRRLGGSEWSLYLPEHDREPRCCFSNAPGQLSPYPSLGMNKVFQKGLRMGKHREQHTENVTFPETVSISGSQPFAMGLLLNQQCCSRSKSNGLSAAPLHPQSMRVSTTTPCLTVLASTGNVELNQWEGVHGVVKDQSPPSAAETAGPHVRDLVLKFGAHRRRAGAPVLGILYELRKTDNILAQENA